MSQVSQRSVNVAASVVSATSSLGRLVDWVASLSQRLGRSIPVSNSSFVVFVVGWAAALLHHPPPLLRTPHPSPPSVFVLPLGVR